MSAFHLSSITTFHGNSSAVYYRVYTEDGVIPSQQPIESGDPFLARIRAIDVAPPHTVASIKRCLSRTENIVDHTHTRLLASAGSKAAMEKEEHIDILTGNGPGSTTGQPLCLVQVEKSDTHRKVAAKCDLCKSSYQGPVLGMCLCPFSPF